MIPIKGIINKLIPNITVDIKMYFINLLWWTCRELHSGLEHFSLYFIQQ